MKTVFGGKKHKVLTENRVFVKQFRVAFPISVVLLTAGNDKPTSIFA
jgi:hypothetical protein